MKLHMRTLAKMVENNLQYMQLHMRMLAKMVENSTACMLNKLANPAFITSLSSDHAALMDVVEDYFFKTAQMTWKRRSQVHVYM